MIYLAIFFFTTLYLCVIERKINSSSSMKVIFICWSPVVFLLILAPSLQFGVGSDYFSYRSMYTDPGQLYNFYYKGEYLFFHAYNFIINNELGEQAIFFFVSIFNTLMLFLTFAKMKQHGYKIWLVFIIFYLVTNIYHSQMNGLRQYMAIAILPLIAIFVFEKKHFSAIVLIALSFLLHRTSLVASVLFFIPILSKLSRSKQLYVFLLMPILMVLIESSISGLVNSIFPYYSHYLSNSYSEGLPISSIYSKLYYIPLFVLFWFYYLNQPSTQMRKIDDYMISIWIVTFWLVLLYVKFGFMYRINSYFVFFYIYPIYFLISDLLRRNHKLTVYGVLMYLFFPYAMKVTILARTEFLYFSVLF